ncbi:MAG: hypothetical protein JHC93_08210 [Parachlamydiales bacterium]|nr:hypothetical protein [Parachlamydiales bacterium]
MNSLNSQALPLNTHLDPNLTKLQKKMSPFIKLSDDQMILIQKTHDEHSSKMTDSKTYSYTKASKELPTAIHTVKKSDSTTQSFIFINSLNKNPVSLRGRGTSKLVKTAFTLDTHEVHVGKVSYLWKFFNKTDVNLDDIENDPTYKGLKSETELQMKVHGTSNIFTNVYIGKLTRCPKTGARDKDLFDLQIPKVITFEPAFTLSMFKFYDSTYNSMLNGYFFNPDNVDVYYGEIGFKLKSILSCTLKLHALGYVHGDIKMENVNWDDGVLIDFGSVKSMQGGKLPSGTLYTQAPLVTIANYSIVTPMISNLALEELIDGKCDAFAIGAMFHPLVFGVKVYPKKFSANPFNLKLCKARCELIKTELDEGGEDIFAIDNPDEDWPEAPKLISQVVKELIAPLPKNRISITNALSKLEKLAV